MARKIRRHNSAFDYPIWDRAVGKVAWNFLDPMIENIPAITHSTRIVGVGCCFVQRMIKFMIDAGYNFYITEPQPEEEPLFTARYGNVNSTRQLLQLFKRAFGELDAPDEATIWKRTTDGQYVDAYRPLFAEAWSSAMEVKKDREAHLECVQTAFEKAEVLLYTMGVTECWTSKSTGIAYPVYAGVRDFEYDAKDELYLNFTASEIVADFSEFVTRLRAINPDVKIIVSLSPLPMAGTYERKKHVLLANCYCKSAIRAAFQEICDTFEHIHYFPVYEIMTGHHTGGHFFENDMRHATTSGINIAMRYFLRHFTPVENKTGDSLFVPLVDFNNVVCDNDL